MAGVAFRDLLRCLQPRPQDRLRSERARRTRGVKPRQKAKQPWLAAGISRSTWYRRRKKAREQAAASLAAITRKAALDRLDWQMTQLRGELETAARYMDEGAAILAELAAMTMPSFIG